MINSSNSHSSSCIVNVYFKHKWIIYVALPPTKWLLLNGKIYTVFHLRKELHPLWTMVWSIGLLFLKLFDVVHTWLQNTYKIIEYRNECVKLFFFFRTNPDKPCHNQSRQQWTICRWNLISGHRFNYYYFVISLLVFCRKF